MWELLWRSVLVFFVIVGLVPLVGGAVLWQVFKRTGITHPFVNCWKAYVIGCCVAYLLLTGLHLVWRDSSEWVFLRAALFAIATTLIVPLYLRDYSRRTWLVVVIAVPLIDALVLALAIGFFQTINTEEPPRRQGTISGRLQTREARGQDTREPPMFANNWSGRALRTRRRLIRPARYRSGPRSAC
ncbi:hypothetical protein AYO44_00620 [Planctomycetaceae bacterium SCGC AG-212-F19]|nr:hypothetical protein AYO44_00620 [Planctomycetaceae bacterium SCGC AG-212-F19]